MKKFTTENILLPDGTYTISPDVGLINQNSIWNGIQELLMLLFKSEDTKALSAVDLGCLEGGYTVEFAKMGFATTGIEGREINFNHCLELQEKFQLPNLCFFRDDVKNILNYGPFDISCCCGILYHLDHPVDFLKKLASKTKRLLIIHTHYSESTMCATFAKNTSEITEHEGKKGRWFYEYDEHMIDIESFNWASYSNHKSFWLDKYELIETLKEVGFDIVFEQFEFHRDAVFLDSIQRNRGLFIAIKR